MPAFRLHTLGELSLRASGGREGAAAGEDDGDREVIGPGKGLAILAFLAATPGHSAGRSYLADLLWTDAPRARSRACLRQAIYYLGRQAGQELLRAEGDRLELREDRLEVDLWELERAAAEGRWEDVVRLHRGPFVPEVPGAAGDEFEARVRDTRQRLDRHLARALSRVARADHRPVAGAGDRPIARTRWTGGEAITVAGRHDWLSLLAPAALTAVGLALAAMLG